MSQKNFVIQDVVHHVRDERHYGRRRVVSSTARNAVRKFWLYLIVIAISSGVGYFAVYLPDAIEAKKNEVAGSMMEGAMMQRMQQMQQMSPQQRQQLMQQYQRGDLQVPQGGTR